MPKKRPITKESTPRLKEIVNGGFVCLVGVRSILAGHLKGDDRLRLKIERLVKDYREFKKECEVEFSKRSGN